VKRSGTFVGVLSKNEFGKEWRRNEFFGWFMVEEKLKTLLDCASTIWYNNLAIFFHPLVHGGSLYL
jgi:hypothetical protein